MLRQPVSFPSHPSKESWKPLPTSADVGYRELYVSTLSIQQPPQPSPEYPLAHGARVPAASYHDSPAPRTRVRIHLLEREKKKSKISIDA